jgi:hypothetical protein
LDSVKKESEGLEKEILVIDSESEEETRELLEGYPDVKAFLFEENTGYAKIVNVGLRESKGEFVLIMNADIVALEGSIKKLISFLETHPEAGIVAPQLLNFNGSIQPSYFRFHSWPTIPCRRTFLAKTSWGRKELERFEMKDFDGKSTREVDWVLGAALMASRQAIEKVGLWDERFFLYFEDTDWARRFWENGWKVVYFPEARMYHYHGRVSKKTGGLKDLLINRYVWIHIASALKYFLKHRGSGFIKTK